MGYRDVILADSPNGFWFLGEKSGTVGKDETGNNNLAYHAAPTFGASGLIAEVGRTCIGPLNGTSQYAAATSNAKLDLGDTFSLEAWVQRGAPGVARTIISKSSLGYGMILDTNGALALWTNTSGIAEATTADIGPGVHYCVVTKTGATVHLYVDGAEPAHGAYTAVTCTDNTNICGVGADFNVGAWFKGYLQAVAIYPAVLSAARVAAHYQAGLDAGYVYQPIHIAGPTSR